MNQAHARSLAREQAAASIQWPEKTLLLFNPDPQERRKLKAMGKLMGFALGVMVLTYLASPLVDYWTKSAT
ncbi:hypothetical protein SCB29_35555, partial [Paraburkholderia sp. SIMBA_055]